MKSEESNYCTPECLLTVEKFQVNPPSWALALNTSWALALNTSWALALNTLWALALNPSWALALNTSWALALKNFVGTCPQHCGHLPSTLWALALQQ